MQVSIYLGIKLLTLWYILQCDRRVLVIPFECVLALGSKVVDVVLEYQLENVVFTDAICWIRMPDRVAQKR